MTNHKAIQSIFSNLRPFTVGFDDMFDHFDMLTTQLPQMTASNYPPYNIVKTGNHTFDIEVALAGWSKDEIEVSTESNVLLIRSKAAKNKGEEEYMHRGISTRTFARGFNLSDDVEIGTVTFTNGMLVVELKRIIPDHQQLKVYDILDEVSESAESPSDSV